MGFWHTGYMDFHEPTGLDGWVFDPKPPTFPCKHCGAIWNSLDDLRKHRFEKHSLIRPILFIDGKTTLVLDGQTAVSSFWPAHARPFSGKTWQWTRMIWNQI